MPVTKGTFALSAMSRKDMEFHKRLYDISIMRCAVIIPVGPGHEKLFKECEESVQVAIGHSLGRFQGVHIIRIDDTSGKLGRSAARNEGVRLASSKNIEWLFFLDADDLILPNAFDLAKEYIDNYDAIWGNILEIRPGSDQPTLRIPQVITISDIETILLFNPSYTLQMGHFVRTEIALNNKFKESMNTGEDFDYYLRLWHKYRCIKMQPPLFINRRGMHSSGPRSANGNEWGSAVNKKNKLYRFMYGLDFQNQDTIRILNNKALELSKFIKYNVISDNVMPIYNKLCRFFPYFGSFPVECFECPPFLMKSNNDDLIVNRILWTGSYEPTSLSIWARLARKAKFIIDVGSYTGIYSFVAASNNRKCIIVSFEALPSNLSRIKENISLNSFRNVRALSFAASDLDGEIEFNVYSDAGFLTSGSSTKAKKDKSPLRRYRVKSACIDSVLKSEDPLSLIKIDVEGSEPDVVKGMIKTIERNKPDVLIEVLDDETAQYLTQLFKSYGYSFYEIKEDNCNIRQTNVVTSGSWPNDLNRFLTKRNRRELQKELESHRFGVQKIRVI